MSDFALNPALDYKRRYKELLDQYKDPIFIPKEKVNHLNETLRAHHVIEKANREGKKPLAELISHSVDQTVITEVMDGVKPEEILPVKKKKLSVEEFIKENAGKEMSLNEIAEMTEMSYAHVNKVAKEMPFLLTKIQKGKYLLRNPDAERKEAKKSDK